MHRCLRLPFFSRLTNTSRVIPEPLPEFFLGNNPFFCDCEMEWLQKVNQMAHQRTHPRVMDLDSVMCRLNNRRTSLERPVPIMQVAASEFLCPYQAHCFALCMCCDFFACDCRMQCPDGCSCFHDSTWSANVIQCSLRGHAHVPPLIPMDATALYLDGNNFTGTLESQSFIGRKRVTSLYLNSSMIAAISNQTFNGLTELEILHLEDNVIHSLQGYEFENLTSLREIHLQRNRIAYISEETFAPLQALEQLFLHDNLLTLQPIWELAGMPALQAVTLSGNDWSCQCDFLTPFVNFAKQRPKLIVDEAHVKCNPRSSEDDSSSDNRVRSRLASRPFLVDANSTCTDAQAIQAYQGNASWNQVLPIAVSIMALCIVLGVGSIIMFVFRTPLRVWLHAKYGIRLCQSCSRRGSGSRRVTGAGDRRDKLYDAFVSYSLKDEDFVHNMLMAQLEAASDDPGYKMCLQHRDLPHNSCIGDTLPSVSQLCSKQMFVVSRAYLESEWTRVKYAIQDLKKWKPLIVLIEELTSLDLAAAPEFNLLLKTSTVIKWSDPGFWNKLRYYLPDAAHFTYRRNIGGMLNTTTGSSVMTAGGGHSGPGTPKLTDRLTTGVDNRAHQSPRLMHAGVHHNTMAQQSPYRPPPQRGNTVQPHQQWSYEGMVIPPSNNSSTSTRSTVTNGGGGSPRTLSSAESSEQSSKQTGDSGVVMASSSSRLHGGNVVANPLDQLMMTGGGGRSGSLGDGLEQSWGSDKSDSAYSWHEHEHTYQTIPTSTNALGEPIYHTLEQDPAGGGVNTIPVMLPNGRLVPATLVRNSHGRIMPFVQVPSSSSGANSPPTTSAASPGSGRTFATATPGAATASSSNNANVTHHSQVTFPKTIVYKTNSGDGGGVGGGPAVQPVPAARKHQQHHQQSRSGGYLV